MAIFEYKCPFCGNIFEELVKKYDDEVFCPVCGKKAERSYCGKMYSSTGKTKGGCTGDCKTCGGCH